jgi:Arc/MetJ-type ribon-helix-helix transcriptional regulator
MRTTETMTVSLPPALLCQFEEVRKKESRTRSELVREALRAYFESRYPVDSPAPDEISALRRGRAAYNRGDAVSLKAFLNDVEPHPHRTGAKRLSKAPAKRSSAR